MPLAGVYLVNPSLSALAAASLMCCGVSKSGSPAPKPTTSMPSAFIALAFESMASVKDGGRAAQGGIRLPADSGEGQLGGRETFMSEVFAGQGQGQGFGRVGPGFANR